VGGRDVFVVDNALSGTPTLTQIAALSQPYGGLTRINDLFYAFHQGILHSIDISEPASPVETAIGFVNEGTGAIAYDPATDTIFAASKRTDLLYAVDPANASFTVIGALGRDELEGGAEWFEGQMFMALQDGFTGELEIGTVDVQTGTYSSLFGIANVGTSIGFGTGLAIVPEPATLLLLALAVGLGLRRR
jgi:hypothetical protein